jgi:hypothetical protein
VCNHIIDSTNINDGNGIWSFVDRKMESETKSLQEEKVRMGEEEYDDHNPSDMEMIIDHNSDYASLSGNELFDQWKANRKLLPKAFGRLLDPELGDEQLRGDLFAAEDEHAMEQYAWAIPDDRALAICQAFAPIVEMGAGAGYVHTKTKKTTRLSKNQLNVLFFSESMHGCCFLRMI